MNADFNLYVDKKDIFSSLITEFLQLLLNLPKKNNTSTKTLLMPLKLKIPKLNLNKLLQGDTINQKQSIEVTA